MGAPAEPPKTLISSGAMGTLARLLKKELAAVSVPRRYSYAEPWNSLVPDLVTRATSAPEPRPTSAAPLLVVVRNSATESSVTRRTLVKAVRAFWSFTSTPSSETLD